MLPSVCQPLGLYVVVNKIFCRQLILKYLITNIDDKLNEDLTNINILSASTWINAAWNKVSSTTIAKCFTKAGFSSCEKDDPNNSVEIPVEESISKMTNLLHSADKNEISASNFMNAGTEIEYQENNLNICKILETVVDSSFTAKC